MVRLNNAYTKHAVHRMYQLGLTEQDILKIFSLYDTSTLVETLKYYKFVQVNIPPTFFYNKLKHFQGWHNAKEKGSVSRFYTSTGRKTYWVILKAGRQSRMNKCKSKSLSFDWFTALRLKPLIEIHIAMIVVAVVVLSMVLIACTTSRHRGPCLEPYRQN